MQDVGIRPISQSTELGEVLKEINNDSIDDKTKMSSIDMRTRLYDIEINSILVIDILVSMGALPLSCLQLTSQKKRLAISRNGMGRREIVEIVHGRQEQQNSGGRSLLQLFGGKKDE